MSSNKELDRFYDECERRDSSFTLGGIDADKPGYHNKRGELIRDGRPNDYSISQVAADKRGSSEVSAGIDLSLPTSKMKLYTGRLKTAALAHDERLWLYGGPVLREFIGTVDGVNVYCYVLTGGVPLGVGKDSGEDPGRDESHLWHIHLSWIRQYAQDRAAMDAVLSVLFGESLDAWRARTGRGNDVGTLEGQQGKQLAALDARVGALALGLDTVKTTWSDNDPAAVEPQWAVQTLRAVRDIVGALAEGDDARAVELMGRLEQIDRAAAERAAALTEEVNEVPGEVIGSLPAHTYDRAIDTLLAAGGEAWVQSLGRAIAERFPAEGE